VFQAYVAGKWDICLLHGDVLYPDKESHGSTFRCNNGIKISVHVKMACSCMVMFCTLTKRVTCWHSDVIMTSKCLPACQNGHILWPFCHTGAHYDFSMMSVWSHSYNCDVRVSIHRDSLVLLHKNPFLTDVFCYSPPHAWLSPHPSHFAMLPKQSYLAWQLREVISRGASREGAIPPLPAPNSLQSIFEEGNNKMSDFLLYLI
jgi:hypothetical protein